MIDQIDLLSGSLKVKSKIKVDAITALEKTIILKIIANVKPNIIKNVRETLFSIFK